MDTCYDEYGREWTFDGVYFSSTATSETYTELDFAIYVLVAHAQYKEMSRRNWALYGRAPRNGQHYSEHTDQGMTVVPPGRRESFWINCYQ
jgi:hypothetical protein